MKTRKLILLFVLISMSAGVKAAVRTVNNNNPSPGQFTNITAAVTASAASGDTIYISGSPTDYGALSTLAKQITIIGTGHNPNKQNPLVSSFIYIDINPAASGTKIIGINFTGVSFVYSGITVTYESCKFSTYGVYTPNVSGTVTTIFNKCVFPFFAAFNSANNGVINATLNNCIFNGKITEFGTSLQSISGSANNCLFLGNATTSLGSNFNTFSFNNNIFYGTSPQITGTNTATTMTKNISFNCPNNAFGGTTLSGNIVNSNPLFTIYAPTGFHYSDNYVLQAGSPGHLTGTDGKDIGLYGGADGINFHMGGDPAIPQIRQMNISTTNLPVGTPVNVNIISTRKQ